MKSKIFIVIFCIQIFAIVILLFQIKSKNSNILGTSINAIDPKTIQKSQSGGLKYFYEPTANSTQEVHENWLPNSVKYTINKDALNERFDYDVQKKEGVYRIITLGDSFTFGQNASTERNWTELLENYLNKSLTCEKVKKYEVINLGVFGYDTQYEVERYKIRGRKYNPDLVIWTFTDYERILEKMMPLIKQYETPENKALENKGIFYHNWQIAREEMIKQIGLGGIVDYQREQIKSLDEYYHGSLIYVTMPHKSEFIELFKQRIIERPPSYFFQLPIDWKQPGLFLPDDHFNDAGHQKMMKEVVGYLIKNKLIPCTQQTNQ